MINEKSLEGSRYQTIDSNKNLSKTDNNIVYKEDEVRFKKKKTIRSK